MKKVQFNRWKKLSLGFAQTMEITESRKKRLLNEVEAFFTCSDVADCYKQINDWDGNEDDFYLCDFMDEHFEEYIHWHYITEIDKANKFYHQLNAVIRAGFDLAVEPSAGVVGWFKKSDISRIFNNRPPKWIKNGWRTDWKKIPPDAYLWC